MKREIRNQMLPAEVMDITEAVERRLQKETAIMAENLSVPAGLIFFAPIYLYFYPVLLVKKQEREIWHRIRCKGCIN